MTEQQKSIIKTLREQNFSYNAIAPNIRLFGYELMIEIIAGIGLYKFLLAIFRLHRKGSFMKNFDTLFSESEHRMKNHIYAEKVARGEKLFEEW
ncbi:hypothetical protein [Ruminobacter sp. RM87]|uniref:hypothetical protein n=1 Tax=Ruminobacter sp. RM87 TaxID=1200567 RepID=UPI0004E21666|nr:hypothetical protein [Ruminobacter sp. RM87]